MAITNGYTTLVLIKARLSITNTGDDTMLEAIVGAASRAIDGFTGRRFYAATETKYFKGEGTDTIFVDDLLSVTTLKTDADGDRTYETTWATTDYDLEPINSPPYTMIVTSPNGRYTWPTHNRAIEIAGSWGYAASAPAAVAEACLIQAARLYKRKDAPFGVAGTPETGTLALPRLDPDVRALLEPFRRIEVR